MANNTIIKLTVHINRAGWDSTKAKDSFNNIEEYLEEYFNGINKLEDTLHQSSEDSIYLTCYGQVSERDRLELVTTISSKVLSNFDKAYLSCLDIIFIDLDNDCIDEINVLDLLKENKTIFSKKLDLLGDEK